MNSIRKSIHKFKREQAFRRDASLIEKNITCRVLIILHLYYLEEWDEIREYLKSLTCYPYKLVITYPVEMETRVRRLNITEAMDNVELQAYPNRGYDVAPFIFALQKENLDSYDVVFKLQTKGTKRRIFIYDQLFLGRDWFTNLFEGIVGEQTVHSVIDILMHQPDTALVAADNLLVSDPVYKVRIVQEELGKIGITVPDRYKFAAGSCFAASARYLQTFLEDIRPLDLKAEDFHPMDAARGFSLAHLLERYLCIAVSAHGYRIQGMKVCGFRRACRKPLEKLCRRFSSQRLLELPYHIDEHFFLWQLDNQFVMYRLRKVKLSQLMYFYPNPPQLLQMKDFFPYRYLKGDTKAYAEYCRFHEEHGLPSMSPERFDALIRSLNENGYDQKNIILISEFDTILDGQHRACWMAYRNGLDYEMQMLEVTILNARRAAEELIPRPVRIMLEKRYLRKQCIPDRKKV